MPVGETAGWPLNRPLLLLVTVKVRPWPDSSAGPALMLVAQVAAVCAPASSLIAWSAPLVKLGASFTAVTVTVTVATLLSRPPSFAL